MPIYEYRCTACGRQTEVLQRMSDPPLEACPECDGKVERMVSAPAFQFKGSGWYVTDYARKNKQGEAGGNGSSSKNGESKASEGKDSSKADSSAKAAGSESSASKTSSSKSSSSPSD